MSEQHDEQPMPNGEADQPDVVEPEVMALVDAPSTDDQVDESVEHPAKVMRVGTMLKTLLEEVRNTDLDEASRDRLKEIYETSVAELSSALSPDLQDELSRLALPFTDDESPTGAELQIAKAQLVGWMEGLIQGIQAMLFAQQMAAQQQLASMRRPQIAPGGAAPGQPMPGQPGQAPQGAPNADNRPGTYL